MITYKILEPNVPGGLGDDTELDTSVHPPLISYLHMEFEDWEGDCLLECFPVWLVTQEAAEALQKAKCTGFELKEMKVTVSEVFLQLNGEPDLPPFWRLEVQGQRGVDDLCISEDWRLMVSPKAFSVLEKAGIPNCDVEDLEN